MGEYWSPCLAMMWLGVDGNRARRGWVKWGSAKGAWKGCARSEDAAVDSVVQCAQVFVLTELLETGCGFGGKVDVVLIEVVTSETEGQVENDG